MSFSCRASHLRVFSTLSVQVFVSVYPSRLLVTFHSEASCFPCRSTVSHSVSEVPLITCRSWVFLWPLVPKHPQQILQVPKQGHLGYFSMTEWYNQIKNIQNHSCLTLVILDRFCFRKHQLQMQNTFFSIQ